MTDLGAVSESAGARRDGGKVEDRSVQAPVLGAEVRGGGERLVMVHGFTQNHRCWGPIAEDLERDHELVLVDAPGHGSSAEVAVSFEAGAGLIGDVGGEGTYLGYSMGGRYCLAVACERPDLVARLVLIGASPGLAQPEPREQRLTADHLLADRLEELGVADFLGEWLANPLFANLSPAMQFVEQRLTNDVAGLASSLRLAGSGAQVPLWHQLATLEMPVLLVTGAFDAKFTDIAEAMATAIGANATHIVIPGAGHTAHLEQPEAFLHALRTWLQLNLVAIS